MRGIISNSLLSQVKPRIKYYEIRDQKLKGFILRVQPSGDMYYRCEYARGKVVSLGASTVLTPAQARDKAREILSQAVLGVEPDGKKTRDQVTFKEFVEDDYEAWRSANRKSGKDDLRRLKVNFVRKMGSRLLMDITPIIIEKWRTNRINSGTQVATVNRDIIILKASLSKAVEWGFIAEHPLRQLKQLRVDSAPKVRYLSQGEEKRLKDAILKRDQSLKNARCRGNEWRKSRHYDLRQDLSECLFADHLTPMVLVSLNTGLRRGELFNLLWANIDFDRAILTVDGIATKNGKTRHIPLNTVALQALQEWRRQTVQEGLVFSSQKTGKAFDNVNKAWDGILVEAEIENFRWHDMRHHFASKLVMAGIDLNTVRELLGHADIKMTLRYAHLAPEHKALAVAKLVT